ncbi:hypothetical protein SELMODRAFT_413380 [Selaginella moellendorffii]|uniref:Uncharacterized protein n=1 Tax=Selaginella moellendorffii TaxID=88036 RepID=D8RP96_SELML|nr:hypothetical protein SELMODRAFT_413380 [Selaginella moellendorffii]
MDVSSDLTERTVVSYSTDEFPACFTPNSGCKAPCRADSVEECADIIEHAAAAKNVESALHEAENISVTSLLVFLVKNNALVGAKIATALTTTSLNRLDTRPRLVEMSSTKHAFNRLYFPRHVASGNGQNTTAVNARHGKTDLLESEVETININTWATSSVFLTRNFLPGSHTANPLLPFEPRSRRSFLL